jgi:indolepyruvate ferredoxin oxidoreductase beta subunit
MKYDVILAGVGGQGTLSIAAIIARAAMNEGLIVRQSEVHGMAQRGGAVQSHLRISDSYIASDLVPKGSADIIISMEPLEVLRYTAWLSPGCMVISAEEALCNISNYPEQSAVLAAINCFPNKYCIKAEALAKKAGHVKAVNMVIAGAASRFLPVKEQSLIDAISEMFEGKSPDIAAVNVKAFQLGRQAAGNQEKY